MTNTTDAFLPSLGFQMRVYGEVGVVQERLLRLPAYLLMAMAMMTGSQPEYNTSFVAGLLRASTTQTGSRATKKAHTRG